MEKLRSGNKGQVNRLLNNNYKNPVNTSIVYKSEKDCGEISLKTVCILETFYGHYLHTKHF